MKSRGIPSFSSARFIILDVSAIPKPEPTKLRITLKNGDIYSRSLSNFKNVNQIGAGKSKRVWFKDYSDKAILILDLDEIEKIEFI
jgi:hypothetical protein